MGTWIIGGIVLASLAAALYFVVRSVRQGKNPGCIGCSGFDLGSCPSCGCCQHEEANRK